MAKEVSDAGRVSVNGRVAKAGTEVSVGDIVTLRYAKQTLEVRVCMLSENPRKESAPDMYEILRGAEQDVNEESDRI